MPRLGNYAYRDVARGIAKLRIDFREGKERNGWFTIDGRPVFPVQSPKTHSGNVPIGTCNAIRQQLHLTTPQFQELVACPLSGDDYVSLIREKISAGTIQMPRS